MKITSRNLWHNPQSAYSPREFVYPSPARFTYRGVDVFRNPAGSWDYVIAGATITQRAGFDPQTARNVIDSKYDGSMARDCACCCDDRVADHLESLNMGFRPLRYSHAA